MNLPPSQPDSGPLTPASGVVRDLWARAGLDAAALQHLVLTGAEPVLPSSFRVAAAAQASVSAAALAAAELRFLRGQSRQQVTVDMRHAAQECSNYLSLDGVVPDIWDKLSGLYPCGPDASRGWVRIHANFRHHRDGALRLLGCPAGDTTERADVIKALAGRDAAAFEQEASDAGLVVAAARTFDEWDRHPQGMAVAALPLFTIEKIGEAPARRLPPLAPGDRPLSGVRILELTRILAGPVGGRTLAAYGADVMLVNSPHLPNIDAIAETSRGKLSVHLDLRDTQDSSRLKALLDDAHVFMQGYHPGGLDRLGFSPQAVAAQRPGIVYVSLSAYSHVGPWAGKRGFDSLVQTATGFNAAEAGAAGSPQPKAMPVQILDHASGYLMAFAAQAALARQMREGGSWHVRVSLAQTAHWLRGLGRLTDGLSAPRPEMSDLLETSESGFGKLVAVRHSAQFAETPAAWTRPSMPPGTHPAQWPDQV